jgi:hypothetical protein
MADVRLMERGADEQRGIGQQISKTTLVAKQHAIRNIPAPFACIGKLRSDLGFDQQF